MYQKYIKRNLDFIFAIILLIFLSPIMILAAIAIKLEDPTGPIFFNKRDLGRMLKSLKLLSLEP